MDSKNGIGKDNSIPWKVKDDMQFVKHYTTGKIIIMGRKTWDSLSKKPLPSRVNVVITSSAIEGIQPDRVFNTTDANLIISTLKSEYPHLDIVIFGGSTVYDMFASIIEKYVVTEIPGDYNCDTFFNVNLSSLVKHQYTFNSLQILEYTK